MRCSLTAKEPAALKVCPLLPMSGADPPFTPPDLGWTMPMTEFDPIAQVAAHRTSR
jgi:hypothetical protein